MILRQIIIIFSLIFISACSAPLTLQNDYDKIVAFEYKREQIKDLSYCSIVLPEFVRQGVCILTEDELGVYWDQKLGDKADKKILFRYKYEDMRKIAHAHKLRLSQIQILAKNMYFSIQIAPDASFVDQEKSREWFRYLKGKEIETIETPTFMTGPVKRYRIIYQ
ncbi:hypothetical protein ACJJH9_12105 [Microbulbifer sp. DLAB2-AF]|uniref:hypothetical protein n=1 Tax=Microbulbifer sp. DLAB2-AF TaxID=3243395 RepID=UPI004038FBEF